MSKEIDKREAELNEAALEDVSGGGEDQLHYKVTRVYCSKCDRRGKCGHSAMDLARYILEHGDSNLVRCPFR